MAVFARLPGLLRYSGEWTGGRPQVAPTGLQRGFCVSGGLAHTELTRATILKAAIRLSCNINVALSILCHKTAKFIRLNYICYLLPFMYTVISIKQGGITGLHRSCGIIVLLLLFAFCSAYSYVSGKESQGEMKVKSKQDQAWTDMYNSFELYRAFFRDHYPVGIYTISRHADSYEEALAYFTQGFDHQMAVDIISTYTFYDPDSKKLLILPTDGLPLLQPENPNLIQAQFLDENKVLFQRYFDDYYGENTRYLYRVFCSYEKDRWKIYRLDWEQIQ